MCTYLKNMEGYKLKDLKLKEFDSIQEMFDRAFKRVYTFEDFRTELVEGKEKRAGTELVQDITKKQKVEDEKETAELKQLMKIIPDEDEVAIDVIPLVVKSPRVLDSGRFGSLYQVGKSIYESQDSGRLGCVVIGTFLDDATYADLMVGRKSIPLHHLPFNDVGKRDNAILLTMYESEMAYQLLKFIMKQLKNSQAVNKSPTHYPCDSARTFRVILFSIHSDEWKSFQIQHQTALRVRFITTCSCSNYKDILLASRFKNQESSNSKTKISANSDIQDLPLRYQVYLGILLTSFQNDAKYEHVGQDPRSKDGKDNKDKQGKDLKISEQKTKSKDNGKGSRSKITKREGTSLQHDKDQRFKNSTTKQS
ncbi:hypothetical protein Tco_0851516 [Tanacetum coccineum]